MIFSTFAEFKKSFKNKNFSQIYAIKNKPKLETIEKLIELVSLNKDSFIFESVEKVKIRGRYTIFGFNPDLIVETKNNRIIQNINNKKKILKKNPYNYFNKLINNFHFKTSKKIKTREDIPEYFAQECAYALMMEELTGIEVNQLVTLMAVENEREPLIFIEKTEDHINNLLEHMEFYKRTENAKFY